MEYASLTLIVNRKIKMRMYVLYQTCKKGIVILTEYLKMWWEKHIMRKSYFYDHVLNETVVIMVLH